MKFNWEGFTALGQQKTGSLEAESEGDAAGKLREMGIMAQNLQPDGPERFKTVFPNSTPHESKDTFDWSKGFSGTQGPPPQDHPRSAEITEQHLREKRFSNSGIGWQENLRMNLADVKIVMEYARELQAGENLHGVHEAEKEMVKQAIMKALKDLRA